MDTQAILTGITAVSIAIGSFWGGRQTAMGIAVDTVELLQVQVATLTQKGEEKDELVADLRGRVEVLEGLVTQRAEVEAVHREVEGIRGVVDRIADKVDA